MSATRVPRDADARTNAQTSRGLPNQGDAARLAAGDLAAHSGEKRYHARQISQNPARVMGWEDAHLHEFVIHGDYYGLSDQDEGEQRETRDERKYRLGDLVQAKGSQFAYNYDFGDYWQHVLVIEKTLPPQEGVRYPVCLAGACVCPPEDVGGISGYEDFVQAIGNSKHPEHEELLAWVGGAFDPEEFDVDQINQKLRGIR